MKRLLMKIVITFWNKLQNDPFETFKLDPSLLNTENLVEKPKQPIFESKCQKYMTESKLK